MGVNTFSFVRLVAIRLGPLPAAHRAKIPFHNGSGFLVYEQLLGLQVFDISIGRSGPQPFAPFCLGLQHRTDLPAGVPNKPLVEQIFERHEIIALCVFRVHIVVDRNVPDAEHRKAFLNVETGVKLVSAKAAEVLGYDDPNLPVFHVRDHLLKCGSLEVTA